MNIVCGTDFSEGARCASRVAGALARTLGGRVHLVHVIDELGAGLDLAADASNAAYQPRRDRLAEEAANLSREFGVEVDARLEAGVPHDVIVDTAVRHHAWSIVISSLGGQKQFRWLLGSVAERVAQLSPLPVFVVRDEAGWLDWLETRRPLRVLAAVDCAPYRRAAVEWVSAMRRLGPCDVTFLRVVSPAAEHARLGMSGALPLEGLPGGVERVLLKELRRWVGTLDGAGDVSYMVQAGWGRVDHQVALAAGERHADVLVVGTHQQAGVARLWQGSTSRGVLHLAETSVVTVPERARTARVARFNRVLVATDLTEQGNPAVAVGYGLVSRGGVIHLVHVCAAEPATDREALVRRLRALIPLDAAAEGIVSVAEVVEADEPHRGILQLAARRGVDAICMTRIVRSELSRALSGSQLLEVLTHAVCPVVVVPV